LQKLHSYIPFVSFLLSDHVQYYIPPPPLNQ
jgi:hypothetical protein